MDIKNDLQKLCKDVKFSEPMSNHTSFKIGGPADILCLPESVLEIQNLIKYFKENSINYIVIGNGSNLLVSDNGIEGAVIKIGNSMSEIKVNDNEIYVEAGALLSKTANVALNAELAGMEALSGIPGSIGGAVCMNAGAYGTEMKDVLKEVTFIDDVGEIKTLTCDNLELGYRKSIFTNNDYIVLSCVLTLNKGNRDEISANMKEYTKRRTQKQPINYPSAGSTFKRPEGYFAGKLVEDCGLKGYSVGGAKISELHAGFIINYDNATAKDVKNLIEHTQNIVFEKFGVRLEPEIKIIGR